MQKLIYGAAAAVLRVAQSALGASITLTQLATSVSAPIGIDYHEPSNQMVGSVNYPSGSPSNFVLIAADGTVSPFSSITGLTDEVKIATARSGNSQFAAGTLFTGNGTTGQIAQVSPDGSTVVNPWVDLGAGAGLMRGSLYVDRSGVYDGDLIAVTTTGQVWRVDGSGTSTMVAATGVHLEGLITVPNDPATYGPLAGKIIAGAENSAGGLLYAIDESGTVTTHATGVAIEDIDLIDANENFYGMNFSTNSVFGSAAADWSGIDGDILLTQEFHGGSTGLFRLFWDGTALVTEEVTLNAGSDSPGQWEHVSFGPAGITEIEPVPAPGALLILGLAFLGLRARQR